MVFFLVKIVIYALSVILIGLMVWTMALGRGLHNTHKKGEKDIFNGTVHQSWARKCFWLAVIIAIAVETLLTIKYGFNRPHIPGFLSHLWSGVVPFGILLTVAVFWITGEHEKLGKWHRCIVYPCFVVALIMATTGDILVYRL
jgi:hypothetical protein